MAGSESWLIATGFVRGVERAPYEMLDALFTCDFEDSDSPVDLCLFADSETV